MTWHELITDIMLFAENLEDDAYVCEYERDEYGSIVNKTHKPITRFNFVEAQNTGAIIIEQITQT